MKTTATKQDDCDVHELWLRILANIRFADRELMDKFVNRLVDTLPPDDIHYLVEYLKELGD